MGKSLQTGIYMIAFEWHHPSLTKVVIRWHVSSMFMFCPVLRQTECTGLQTVSTVAPVIWFGTSNKNWSKMPPP